MTVQFCPHRRFGGRRDISRNGFLGIPVPLLEQVEADPVLWVESDGTVWQLDVPPGDDTPIIVSGDGALMPHIPRMVFEEDMKLVFSRAKIPCKIGKIELDKPDEE